MGAGTPRQPASMACLYIYIYIYIIRSTAGHRPGTVTGEGHEHPLWSPSVGEFRKTRHPRNVKSDKVLKTCFSGVGNSRFSEAWNLRSLEFANVRSSGILIRRRNWVTNMRKPGTRAGNGANFGGRPIRESVEDQVRGSRAKTCTNR
jgi:hypothetical protein